VTANGSRRTAGGQQLGLFGPDGGTPRGRAASRSRLFFALDPPKDVRAQIAEVVARMPAGSAGRARRVKPGRFHLTLAFLGDMNRAQQDAAILAADRVEAESFGLILDRVGYFPGAHVAWIGPSAIPAGLSRLKAELDRELLRFGLPAEVQMYQPHVTCLRAARDVPDMDAFSIEWTVCQFALMRSSAEPDAAEYEPLNRWPLQLL
jgi:2'-5' RNA ligase